MGNVNSVVFISQHYTGTSDDVYSNLLEHISQLRLCSTHVNLILSKTRILSGENVDSMEHKYGHYLLIDVDLMKGTD